MLVAMAVLLSLNLVAMVVNYFAKLCLRFWKFWLRKKKKKKWKQIITKKKRKKKNKPLIMFMNFKLDNFVQLRNWEIASCDFLNEYAFVCCFCTETYAYDF